MIKFKNFLIVLFSAVIGILIVEIFYNFFFRDDLALSRLDKSQLYKDYTKEEKNKNLPIRHKFNGGKCVQRGLMTNTNKMNWHPKFGANDNIVNIDCINELFSKKTTNIIFFGGSSMFNHEAPNYLTSIEFYAFKDNFDRYRSINLANSGARMSNNLASFIEHVPKIKNVDHVIFLDGINEFTSVQLGSSPEFDTYWAQGIEARINNPQIIIIEKLISKSLLFEFIFTNIFNYKSIRDKSNVSLASESNINIAANDYSYRKKITQILCQKLLIKCHFLLQPAIFFDDTKKSFSKEIEKYYEKLFDENLYLYKYGYEVIKKQNSDIIDLSNIFNGKENLFFDSVHFNKYGSKIIGENILAILKNYEN